MTFYFCLPPKVCACTKDRLTVGNSWRLGLTQRKEEKGNFLVGWINAKAQTLKKKGKQWILGRANPPAKYQCVAEENATICTWFTSPAEAWWCSAADCGSWLSFHSGPRQIASRAQLPRLLCIQHNALIYSRKEQNKISYKMPYGNKAFMM